MPYIVKAPKDPRLEEAFQYRLKKIGEGDDFLLYQGIFEAIIPLGMSWSDAAKVVKKVKVEGGYKRLPRVAEKDGKVIPNPEPILVILPKRNRILTVRLSGDEYNLLKEDAYSVGRSVSGWARELVMNLVWEYLQREKFKEAMRKVKENPAK